MADLLGQDYALADGSLHDDGWASRRADIMERASANAQLRDSEKVERRLKCQQEEFLGCLKQHEDDKLTLGKYLQELEAKNAKLEAEKAEMQQQLDEAGYRAENFQLAIDEFREERESLLKYWKQDQKKLAKLVGPDYDQMDVKDVKLIDIYASEIVQEQPGGGAEAGGELSTFQKRMQARTRDLHSSLTNEKSVQFRLNPDGTLSKAPEPASRGEQADPDQTQCYYSPLDGCFHILGEEEKKLAAKAGATLNTAVLGQESEEVRKLSRRVAELEFSATLSGSSLEELQALQEQLAAAQSEASRAKQRAEAAETLSARTRLELEGVKSSAGRPSDGMSASLQNQVQELSSKLQASNEEKDKLKMQHAKEKDMFMSIADGLGKEVTETQRALAAVFESYPHLKDMVQQSMVAGHPAS